MRVQKISNITIQWQSENWHLLSTWNHGCLLRFFKSKLCQKISLFSGPSRKSLPGSAVLLFFHSGFWVRAVPSQKGDTGDTAGFPSLRVSSIPSRHSSIIKYIPLHPIVSHNIYIYIYTHTQLKPSLSPALGLAFQAVVPGSSALF